MHFKNKVVWITGASSGIGAELAFQFAKQQARLILTARDVEALEKVRLQCTRDTHECSILAADMLNAASLADLSFQAYSIYSKIDVIIFSAGQSQRSMAVETNIDVYRKLMDLNFMAPVIITQSLFKLNFNHLHLVPISSVAGLMGFPMRTGYAASKHALKGYFESLQTEQKSHKLTITIVSPGRINTPVAQNAITGDGKAYGEMDKGQLNGMPADICARKIIRAVQRKRKHVIIARSERLLWWIWWFIRPLYYTIAAKKGLPVKSVKAQQT
jgi:dehydrogenase/reductase SDR family member 7B